MPSPAAKPRKTSSRKTARKTRRPVPRACHVPRQFTAELLENGRYRYEETDEPVRLIAEDFGLSRTQFDRRVATWEWRRRRTRVPRGLPVAQRIRQEAADAVAQLVSDPAAGEPAAVAAVTPAAADARALIERLQRAVEKELAAAELMRAHYGPLPQRSAEAQRTAHTLATLTDTLVKVQRLRANEAALEGGADEMPRDLEEFRRELTRRIAALLLGPPASVRMPATGGDPSVGDPVDAAAEAPRIERIPSS